MRKFNAEEKGLIKNAFVFILGVAVTIGLTKMADKAIPNDPIIVKQYVDTIKIVHEMPSFANNDSLSSELEIKTKNLELLNNYDRQIQRRLSIIESGNKSSPNLIVTHHITSLNKKGYTIGSSSPYFSSECPTLKSKYCDILISFMNPQVTKDIAYLRVNIYRYIKNNPHAVNSISEEFYEVKQTDNLIRINNDFENGKYEITYGFILKKDLNEEYPTFYSKKCIVVKQ
ncbi:MAG: hypothetical protein K0R51_1090 [Cytophagaceae bacterium]|jgi:hypothetical protein|nr:hypothetical protein [Cytophagaceae bacterium]